MPTPSAPSAIWAIAIDQPVVQDATYSFNKQDRTYLDSQILGVQTHLVQSLLSGVMATWLTLDSGATAVNIGDCICVAGTAAGTVTRATTSTATAAGSVLGVALSAAAPGSLVRVAVRGILPTTITGLAAGASVFAILANTGRITTAASIPSPSTTFIIGTVDAAGNLTLNPLGAGAAGSVTWATDLAGSNNSSQVVVSLSTSNATIAVPNASLVFGSPTASAGLLRAPNNVTVLAARNNANNGDLKLISTDSGNEVIFGDNNNGALIFATPGSAGVYFQLGGTNTIAVSSTLMQLVLPTVQFWGTTTPTINQVNWVGTGANNGNTFTIQAQQGQTQTGGNANNNGGALLLIGGLAGTGGGGAAGTTGPVKILTGATTVAQLGNASSDFLNLGAGNPPTAQYLPTGITYGGPTIIKTTSGYLSFVGTAGMYFDGQGGSPPFTFRMTGADAFYFLGPYTAPTLQFSNNAAGGAGTAINFAALGSDTLPANFTIQGVNALPGAATNVTGGSLILKPGAGASGASGSPGNLVINIPAPGASGTTGMTQFQQAGTTVCQVGQYVGSAGFAGFYGPVTPSANNYGFIISSTATFFNAPSGGTVYFRINNSAAMGVYNALGLQLFNETAAFGGGNGVLGFANSVTPPSSMAATGFILYSQNVTLNSVTQPFMGVDGGGVLFPTYVTPYILQSGLSADNPTVNLSIQAQNALAGAVTNRVGGSIVLTPGTGATANGTGGNVNVVLQAPSGTGTEAMFQLFRFSGGNTFAAAIGPDPGSGSTYSCLWLGPGITPANNNYVLAGASGQTYINSTTTLYLQAAGNAVSTITSNGVQIIGSSVAFGGGQGVVGIANATTPCNAVPAGGSGAVVWQDSIGLHYNGPSASFLDFMIAPTQQGTITTQQNKQRCYSGPGRTTTNSAVTILTIPLTTAGTNAGISVLVQGRDQTAGTVTDGVCIQTVFQFKNVSGTLSQGATVATPLKANDTSMAACTCTATFSGTNILIQVTGLAAVIIDWMAYATVLIN